jgi:hypothetical protein
MCRKAHHPTNWVHNWSKKPFCKKPCAPPLLMAGIQSRDQKEMYRNFTATCPPPPSIGREQNILTAPIPLTYSLTSTRPCGVPTSLYYESGAPLHSCRGRVCAVGWGHLTQLSPCMSECLQSQTLPLHSVMQTEHRLLHG